MHQTISPPTCAIHVCEGEWSRNGKFVYLFFLKDCNDVTTCYSRGACNSSGYCECHGNFDGINCLECSLDYFPIGTCLCLFIEQLKRAYSNILQEKEEQLLQLKEEVVDLKTLVRVLESDNDRMRGILQKWGSA